MEKRCLPILLKILAFDYLLNSLIRFFQFVRKEICEKQTEHSGYVTLLYNNADSIGNFQ